MVSQIDSGTTPSARPVLYSYRRCPYAMRARMALKLAEIPVSIIDIDLRDKPAAMLQVSPKGTVPVLCLPDGRVLEESLDIVHWALSRHDPANWLRAWGEPQVTTLLNQTEGEFKRQLDRYKYASRFPDQDPVQARSLAMAALIDPLSSHLQNTAFVDGETPGVHDLLIFPFVRQFAGVEPAWFESTPHAVVRHWLAYWLESPLFTSVMKKAAN